MKNVKNFLRSLKKSPLYAGGFESRESVFGNFEKSEDEDIVICYAYYGGEQYEGYATVLFYRMSTRKYYEVYGSHCSCYGLEGQWDKDEEVNMDEIQNRLINGDLQDGNVFKDAFEKFKG